MAIPNPRTVGLRGPGWLWGDRLANVAALDVEECVGGVDEAMAESIITLAGLEGDDATALRSAARREEQP